MWLGDFSEDFATVTCMFTTHDSTGAPVAPLSAFEAADVVIFKNGSATEKTSSNGVTMTSPFNSTTGLHCVVLDTSNDTGDGGFWVAGAVYTLVLTPDETVDGIAVAKVIGQFGIEVAGSSSSSGASIAKYASGTVTTGATTTAVPTSALTVDGGALGSAVADQWKGRTVIFDGNTTATLKGVAKPITASSNSVTPTLTVAILPATPASGDTFKIV